MNYLGFFTNMAQIYLIGQIFLWSANISSGNFQYVAAQVSGNQESHAKTGLPDILLPAISWLSFDIGLIIEASSEAMISCSFLKICLEVCLAEPVPG